MEIPKPLEYAVENGYMTTNQATTLYIIGMALLTIAIIYLGTETRNLTEQMQRLGCAKICNCEDLITGQVYYPPYSSDPQLTPTPEYENLTRELV